MAKRRLIGLGAGDELLLKAPGGVEVPLATQRTQGTVYLLVDCSSSMGGPKLEEAQGGAKDFARQSVSKGYNVGLVSFHDHAQLVLHPTRDLHAIDRSVSSLEARGSTNMTGALELALDALLKLPGNRAAVLVSDGAPNDPASTKDAARRLAGAGVQIITVATTEADVAFLSSLATASDLALVVGPSQLRAGIAKTATALPPLRPS